MRALLAALALLQGAAPGGAPAHPRPGLWEFSYWESSPGAPQLPERRTARRCLGADDAQGLAAPQRGSAGASDASGEGEACEVLRSEQRGDTVSFALTCRGEVDLRTEGYVTLGADRIRARATTRVDEPGQPEQKVWHELSARRIGDCPGTSGPPPEVR